MTVVIDQLDLFSEQEAAEATAAEQSLLKRRWSAPNPLDWRKLGLTARAEAEEVWEAEFGSLPYEVRAAQWRIYRFGAMPARNGRHGVALINLDIRCDNHTHRDCSCVEAYLYRGVCPCCDWEGPSRVSENAAVEDCMDRAWPGWRIMPLVNPPNEAAGASKKAVQAFWDRTVPLYPKNWLTSGGPVLTMRSRWGSRHVESRTPWKGYDMGVVVTDSSVCPSSVASR